MKNVLLLFLLQISFSVYSQNYEKQWNKIFETEAKGNVKEAYEAVLKIEKKAQKKNNQEEMIKVFLFKSKYENILFDKRHSDFFAEINTQIANANGNSVYFYNYIKAAYLAAYFNKYQSDIQRRGDSKNTQNQSNFTEWNQRDFINALTNLYNQTFSDSDKLQAIPLSDYKEVVEGFGKVNQEHLYEFLLEKWMLLPIAQLYINAEPSSHEFYSDYKDSFLTRDLSENFDVRLTAYQMLENFYKQEQKNYDYERVKFMRFQQNFLLNDLKLLDVLIATTSTNEFKNKYRLEKLSYLVGEANAKENKLYLKEAILLIDTLKTQEISITDLNQILNLEKSIKQQRLIVYNEPILYNNQHNKILVDFKNIDTLYNFVYKVDDLEMFNQLKSDSLYFDYLKTHKPFQNIESVMPNQGDFNSYTTEVLLPDFEEGYYFLVSSYEQTVTENTPSVRFNPFVVTDVFIVYKQFEDVIEFQLLNRKTGKPLSETKVFVFDKFYTSDENGFVKIKIDADNFDRKAKYPILVYSDDFIYQETFSGNQFYFSNYNNDEDEERQITSFIYTDRGLYRPGQEVYIKAILVETVDGFKHNAVKDLSINVELRDSRYNVISNLILTTNDFGSVSGKFMIPKNVDDGEFIIQISEPEELTEKEQEIWNRINLDNDRAYFHVAEYKRNTYEVNFNPYQENIEIGETIKLSGSVKSYAQASIANAKVTIKASHWLRDVNSGSKTVNYPAIEIFTDANGNFNFPFSFVKDSLTQNDLNTQIEYYFYAEVVDESGEVREARLQINYDVKPFSVKFNTENNTFYKNRDKFDVEIVTSTINGKFVPTKGKVKVYKRQGIKKFQLETLWMKPTTQIIDSVTLADKFPFQTYAYHFEKNIPKLVFEQEYETKENEKFVLDEKLFDLGEYYLQFIPNDSLFIPARHDFYFSVFDYTFHVPVAIEIDEEKSLRSKKLQLKIFSKVPEVYVNLDLNYLGNQNKSFLIHLKQGENLVELPIDIENRDIRFKSNLYFVYENRLFKEFVEILFPYRKDYSTIKTEILHLNDKLNPGDDYNWKLKVFNQNKPKDKLEVLATMYDFSLDAIHNERWDNFYFYDYGSSNLASVLNQTTNFVDTEIYYNSKSQFIFKKSNLTSKLNFNWFGFRFFDKNITKEFLSETKLNTVQGEISGRVFSRDYGDNIPGATVLIQGTTNGVDTDEDGYFRLKAKQGDVISVQYLGFKTLRFIVDGSYFEIPLEEENELLFDEIVVDTYRTMPNYADAEVNQKNKTMSNVLDGHANIKARKNLSETAFFYPNLYPNEKGEVEIKFKAPEALTKWKLKTLANDKHGNSNYFAHLAYTQRNVMIQPNMPRFVRETDDIELKARVSNTTNTNLKVTALLRLFNTVTGEELTDEIIKTKTLIPVDIQANSSNSVSWKVQIPKNIEGLQYRISVQAGNFTDAEESVIPVLSNRQLVTETIPVWQLANETKKYELTNLVENQSTSLENHQLRIDISNNATWLMMQSLPYLYEYPYNCSEQLFAKYFAYAIAAYILETNEPIQKLVAAWRENPKSKFEENDELNQILAQDLPWLKDLISDDEKKAQFVCYFDEQNLLKEVDKIEDVLIERQTVSGGISWFDGGRASNYITNHILITAAKLKKLNIEPTFISTDKETKFINKANVYLDVTFNDLFTKEKEATVFEVIDYALVKSYYADVFSIPENNKIRIDKRLAELRNDWITLPLYEKAKLILIANKKGDKQWANEITNQLEQTVVLDETYGMFWRENVSTYYFNYNEAEVQALLVEAFKEMKKPQTTINKLNTWLISRKSQSSWGTTKATTEALYAILLGEDQNAISKESIKIKVGNDKINKAKNKNEILEEAVGMFSYRWLGNKIKSDMGKIEVENKTSKPVFGGIYWQYFQDLNQIKQSQDEVLNINRSYLSQNKDEKWDPINPETKLVLGQKVKIRLTIEAKRDLSFVHLKDNRAATFEPIDVLSKYHYKDRIFYYQTNKDASTNFFFDVLPKGNHILEYEVRLNNIGNFTSGISTIQSMFAPAHSAHTSGDKVEVK